MASIKHCRFTYRLTQLAAKIYSSFVFKKKFLRNEIRGKKGPFVVIANHECVIDFANLVGATREMMTFVISDSFYKTVPVKGMIDNFGAIAKKQFETTVSDMRKMKNVIADGGILVIYPAGLMCEDGLSTPIPEATYRFLKWLGTDIYMARTYGSYFVKPKWSKKTRRGRTYLDIYKLFDKDELRELSEEEIRKTSRAALLFDAYRDQEDLKIKYRGAKNIEGLENVLYACPCCGKEFTMSVKDKSKICCSSCGFTEEADEYGFLHKTSDVGDEIRYVSDWSRLIYNKLAERTSDLHLTQDCKIYMINEEKRKFLECGSGTVEIKNGHISLTGVADGETVDITMSCAVFPSLPFKPGEYLEIQCGDNAYRCYLNDGKQVMKFVNAVKAMHCDEITLHSK